MAKVATFWLLAIGFSQSRSQTAIHDHLIWTVIWTVKAVKAYPNEGQTYLGPWQISISSFEEIVNPFMYNVVKWPNIL